MSSTPTDSDWVRLRLAEEALRGEMPLEQWTEAHTQYLQALAACATKGSPSWYEEAAVQKADLEQFDAIWDAMIDYRDALQLLVERDPAHLVAIQARETLTKHGDLPE